MANIWIDHHVNNENRLPPSLSGKKLVHSARKSQILCDLNNRLHLQSDVFPGVYSASKTLRHDVLRKQVLKQNFERCLEQELKVESPAPTLSVEDDVDLFDCWDAPAVCCTTQCQQSDQEIWLEMNLLSDALFDKVFSCNATTYDSETDDADWCESSDLHADYRYEETLFDIPSPTWLTWDGEEESLSLTPIALPIYTDSESDSDDDAFLF